MFYKHLMNVAIAATILTACNQEEITIPDVNDGEAKSIYLKFETNRTKTRAIEGSASGNKAIIHSAIIYFLDGNESNAQVYDVRTVGGENEDYSIDDLEEGIKFEDIPSPVRNVYVIGNYNSSDENKEFAQFPVKKGTLLSEIQNVKAEIQQVNYMNIGTDNPDEALQTILEGMANVISYKEEPGGWDDSGSSVIPDEEDSYANVEVSPLNARIEVVEMEYTGDELKSFTIEGIYINGYYSAMTIGLTSVREDFIDNGSSAEKYDRTEGNTEFAYTDFSTMYDVVDINKVVAEETIIKPEGDQKVWAYQVFGNHNPVPHIIVKLTNIVDNDDREVGTRYLTVKGFRDENNQSLTSLERGKVYNIKELKFDDSNLSILPELDTVSIWVRVTVKAWKEVAVTPEL